MVISLVLGGAFFLPFEDLACIFSFRESRIFLKSSLLAFLLNLLLEVCDVVELAVMELAILLGTWRLV